VFDGDSEADLAAVERRSQALGAAVARTTAFATGGRGAEALAARVLDTLEATDVEPPEPHYLYRPETPFAEKVRVLGRRLYGAADVVLADGACRDLEILGGAGFGDLPVCVAKTHLSFSDDPKAGGLASGMTLTVNEVRPAVGAGFLVALMGRINTMPGLPREPAARRIRVDSGGSVTGLR